MPAFYKYLWIDSLRRLEPFICNGYRCAWLNRSNFALAFKFHTTFIKLENGFVFGFQYSQFGTGDKTAAPFGYNPHLFSYFPKIHINATFFHFESVWGFYESCIFHDNEF